LWLGGPSVTAGYYNKPELTRAVYGAKIKRAESNTDIANEIDSVTFLRTGDLGFLQEGKLFICGRSKDLIIYNGVNYYPQDLEFAAQEANKSVRPGCVAAFAAAEIDDGLTVQIVFELRRASYKEAAEICTAVKQQILQPIGIPVKSVVAIEEKTIPKTTSGKIQRRATREALQNGTLKVVALLQSEEITKEQAQLYVMSAEANPDASLPSKLFESHATSSCGNTEENVYTILASLLGEGFDAASTWEDLGITSITAVEFQNLVSDRLSYQLSPSFQEEFLTPRDLRLYMERDSDSRVIFEVQAFQADIDESESNLSWNLMSVLQAIGICLHLLIISFSMVPAYQFGKFVASESYLTEAAEKIRWQWLPLIIPMWMLSFSCFIVICKWVIIGRYRERAISVPSFPYFQWWFVDRLVHVWERWVGRFIKDTPLLWLFYWLLGATIHPSVALNAFIREFDLIKIDGHSKIDHDLACRRFRPWLKDELLQLVFRGVEIGSNCTIKGLVLPGGIVQDGSDVENLSAVGEGAIVPKSVMAKASPAYGIRKPNGSDVGETAHVSFRDHAIIGMVKISWLMVELYLFAALLVFSQWIMHGRLPVEFRYSPLFYWLLVFLLETIFSASAAIALKWLILGERYPGDSKTSLSVELREWIVDYHCQLTLFILDVIDNSKLNNLYLKSFGMDIDVASHIWARNIKPSQLDFVSLKRTFLSWTSFDIKHNEQRKRIEISGSSFGHTCVVRGGACVKNAQIAPLSIVEGDIVAASREMSGARKGFQFNEFRWTTEFMFFMYLATLAMSTIPAFELFQMDWGDTAGLGYSVVRFALVLALQTGVWLVLFWFFQHAIMQKGQVTSVAAYPVYMSAVSLLLLNMSLLGLAQDTCFFNAYLEALGAKING